MRYKLTQKGQNIYPLMLALMKWSSRWPTEHLDPAISLVHPPCGCRLKMHIACSACEQELLPKDVTLRSTELACWIPNRRGDRRG